MYATWVEVDLGAIKDNISLIKKSTSAQVVVVIKANGYGHGALPVAKAAMEAGAAWLAVARVEEVRELRQAGLDCPIMLFGRTPPSRLDEMIQQQVSLTVWEDIQVEQAAAAASRVGIIAKLQIKVDTGMGRLGAKPQDCLALVAKIKSYPMLTLEGIFTHFARADETDLSSVDQQQHKFVELLQALNANGYNHLLIHAANSAASLCVPEASFNLVRPGIAVYGLNPSRDCKLPSGFKPALSWKASLSQVKILPAGHGVSYGHEYVTTREECIGVLPVGYADGFRRTLGNQALVGGKKVPVVGRVCMDMCMLQLDDVPDARAGDEIVLIGRQGDQQITTDDIATAWGTVNYEVVCGIGARVPRVYL